MADERVTESSETVERVEARGGPVPPPEAPMRDPELEETLVHESETVRPRADGAIERDVVRHEQRRRMSGDRIALLLLLLLLLVAAGIGAWWYFTQQDTTSVPTVEGLTVDRAVARLSDENLESDVVTQPSDAAQGTVFRQDPAAGTDVDKGSTVRLLVSGGPESVAVPNAVGLQEAQARDRLVAAGFEVQTRRVFSGGPPGTVVAQNPAAGADAEARTTVTINVSRGPDEVGVPNVVGLSRAEAESEVRSAGLEANAVVVPSNEPEGTVVAQSPTGGNLRRGEAVRLNVSEGPSTTAPEATTPTTTSTTSTTTTP